MPDIVFIETARLLLRQWKPTDSDLYVSMNSDEKVMEFFPLILSAEQSLQHINTITRSIDEKGYGLFAIEKKDDGSFIGFTGFSHPRFEADFTPCIEIGWRIAKQYWNKGFATEAAKACISFGFITLQLNEIYSWTSIHNKASEQVMKKIGMQKTGEFDHPLIDKDHYLQKHVLYKITPQNKL